MVTHCPLISKVERETELTEDRIHMPPACPWALETTTGV